MKINFSFNNYKFKFIKSREIDGKIITWIYLACKSQHQRDVNAAINIKRVGAATLSGESLRAIL